MMTASALVFASIIPSGCSSDSAETISNYIRCGDKLRISSCLSAVAGWNRVDFLRACLVDGGCSEPEAAIIAESLATKCDQLKNEEFGGDLKKRDEKSDKTSAAPATTAPATTEPTTTEPVTTEPVTTEPATTTKATLTSEATPTTPKSSASTPSNTAASSTSSTPSATTTPPSSTMTTTASSTSTTSATNSPLVCLTTSQSSVTWCITTTAAGAVGTNCFPTFTPIIECAPGLICQVQDGGDTTCMVRQDNLTTSGLIVTVIFSTIVFAFLASLFGMCFKSRRLARKQARQREAALVSWKKGGTRDVEASNTYNRRPLGGGDAAGSEAHLPLMAAQGPAGGNGSIRDVSADYANVRPSVDRVPSGSYQDVVVGRKPVPISKLHPGMMTVDGEDDDMGYGRGRQGSRDLSG